ncbi:LacI family DNA-binding transcriptional regulator [Ruania halotolerans]|uniref:LacI family DNA-binding transcriptional regulator n=1 Tax=Ruania halotolerans TaxID=2897773 RepID=UPI001E5406B3|nr:LacI family DNA-binding transcriptional regulator [Ruania halotolerans]UFU07196.1 LacI family transcriptional regulator [Ruania halotolerans]
MAVTMRQVAQHAGVSLKTVSNVVNQYEHVSASMRSRVLAAIDELGYQMNVTARNLSTGRTGMLALAVPELQLPYFAELADAVMDAADELGYTVLIEPTAGMRTGELDVLRSPRRSMSDGLIYSPTALRDADAAALAVDFPMVLLGERALTSDVDHIVMANEAGGRMLTEHLLAQGCRRIAIIGAHDAEVGAGSLRLRGVRAALTAAGLDPDDVVSSGSQRWSRETGRGAVAELLTRGAQFDGLLALNDAMALGAMRALWEAGVEVPGQVRVAGFDDIEESRYARPSLTTVNPGREEIARTAVRLLVDRIEGRATGVSEHQVPATLVVRESSR